MRRLTFARIQRLQRITEGVTSCAGAPRPWISLMALLTVGCGGAAADVPAGSAQPREPSGARHAVAVSAPSSLSSLSTGETGPDGRPVRVPCATCHSLRKPGKLPADASELGLPHTGLRVQHGELRCAACHAPDDPIQLHLADARALPMTEAMALCSQCHGPQRRDYDHGAHGGMRGYWDLTRGPRQRNHCVDCHDPHAPAFPRVRPAPPPRDRFLAPHAAREEARTHHLKPSRNTP